MTTNTPTAIMEEQPMGVAQWLAVFVTFGLNALDGFDVLSISFAGPGIAADWGLDQATLGWLLAMELIGMAAGSIVLGIVGDKAGRRSTMLFCLVVMSVGMFGAGQSGNVGELAAWRVLTGLGIGGMLAVTAAATAEFSNFRWRSVAMALFVVGYPVGGIIGGFVVRNLLVEGTWHDIFTLGGWVTAAFIPVVLWLIPESPVFLDRMRRPGALERINRSLARLGHSPATELSRAPAKTAEQSVTDIFKPDLIKTTIFVTAAYFLLITSFYFLVKWVPKIVVDMGYQPSAAAVVLAWISFGGAAGTILYGIIATRVLLRPLTISVLIGAALMIYWFGSGARDLAGLTLIVGCAGFFTNSAICGMYSLFAKVFPTQCRSTGTGFAIGVGRGGAALAPVVAGYLFQAGFGLQTVAIIMGSCAILAAVLLFFISERPTD